MRYSACVYLITFIGAQREIFMLSRLNSRDHIRAKRQEIEARSVFDDISAQLAQMELEARENHTSQVGIIRFTWIWPDTHISKEVNNRTKVSNLKGQQF